LLVVASFTSQAENPADLSIGLEVSPDGSWKVVELFGQPLVLDPQSFNSVARLLGLQFELPAQLVDPAVVGMLTQADIAQVTLTLEGEAARVWLNDLAVPQVKVHLQNLGVLLPEQYAAPYGFLSQVLKFVPGTLYVRFTPEAMAKPDMTAMPMAEAEAVNTVRLAATVDPEGQLLSAGGFTRAEVDPLLSSVGLVIPDVDPGVMAMLAGFDTVGIDVTPGGLAVLTNEAPVVELVWDAASRQMLLGMAEGLVGLSLDPQMVELAETWLESTQVSLALHVAETPQDELVAVEFGQPLAVALETGGLDVAGMTVPLAGVDLGMVRNMIQAYGIDQAQVCWGGDELRWTVNGLELPYLTAESGWLTRAIRLTGWEAHPLAAKLEQLLAQTALPVAVLVAPGAAAAEDCGAYQVAMAPAAPLSFGLNATWNPEAGELALKDVGLPFSALGMLPMGIAAQFRLPAMVAAYVPRGVSEVEASLRADGVSATVDDVEMALHWDATLLENLAQVADGVGAGASIRQVVPVLNLAEISVNIERVGGAIAVSAQ
jgi:hypothetical protein